MSTWAPFAAGLVFALGLGLAGMTQPGKVIGFLDIFGAWDPTLAFVMGSAVAVSLVAFDRILRRDRALGGDAFVLPPRRDVDAPLLIGAGIFGIGWGLSGYCPGPAVVSLATLSPAVIVFAAGMGVGLLLGGRLAPTLTSATISHTEGDA